MRLQVLRVKFTHSNKQAKNRLIVTELITPNPLKGALSGHQALKGQHNAGLCAIACQHKPATARAAGSVANQRFASPHNQRYVKWPLGLSCPIKCAVPYGGTGFVFRRYRAPDLAG